MSVLSSLNCVQTSTFFDKKVWEGEEKIIIAIDCGTTFSGVAYSYLFPKGRQYVQRVLQWPGQGTHKGEAKIPTLVWYDEKGQARAFGAEALTPEIREQAEEEDWQLAEHFKLHLHPNHMRAEHDIVVQPLPKGIAIEQIYADFFGYLHKHTKQFFEGREVDGSGVWNRLEQSGGIEWVIACPNGWGPWEHGMLRKAAVLGGLVPTGQSNERIQMVTEAEASVHYVMSYADMEERLKSGTEFIVCDAGGSTVDTTLYVASKVHPVLKLKERQTSGCVQAGAIFVNQAVHKYFDGLFSAAGITEQDRKRYTREAVESFESGPKKAFQGPEQDDFSLDVGGHRFSDASIGIRRGRKALSGTEMESFFMSLVNQILNNVQEQMKGHSTKYIMLVGGFGDSPYLRKRFQSNPMFKGVEVIITNDSTAKAVAEGAVMWKIQHAVAARATRFSYGVEICPDFKSGVKHAGRKVHAFPQGPVVREVWFELVAKGRVVKVDEHRRLAFTRTFTHSYPDLSNMTTLIYVRTANEPANVKPYFMTDLSGGWLHGIEKACTINANMSNAVGALSKRSGKNGPYWQLRYDILVYFGRTELVAQLAWKDPKGKEHKGPTVVIPEKF